MNPTLLLVIVGGLAVLLLIGGLVSSLGGGQRVVEERLERVAAGANFRQPKAAPSGPRASPLGETLNRALEGRGFAGRIARDLARADLKLNVGEYLALIVIAGIGSGVVGAFVGKSIFFGILAGLGGLFAPRFYVGFQQGNRVKRFDGQLADMINLMVNGLRAGYSSMQAMEAVSREMPAPSSDEFRRVVQEMQLGLPMEVALANLQRRVASLDLDLMITAINVQREVGGNLADILDTISETIRERVRIKGEIRVLTSQQMATAYLIAMIPPGLGVFLYIVNPSYMGEFFTNGLAGWAILGAAAMLVTVGFLIIRKIVDIEV